MVGLFITVINFIDCTNQKESVYIVWFFNNNPNYDDYSKYIIEIYFDEKSIRFPRITIQISQVPMS